MADSKDKAKCQDPECPCPDCGAKKGKESEGKGALG